MRITAARAALTALAAALALACAACTATPRPVVPVAEDARAYADAIARAQQEQLLLNIVRLRYNDPVAFVEIERLTTQDRIAADARLSSATALDGSPFSEILSGNIGAQTSHQPTIVYENLRGKGYAEQLLRPLPPESVFLLSQSGWNIEQLMLCCVARIGDVDNARIAAGPRLGGVPDNARFRELAALMRRAQEDSNLIVQVVEPPQEGGLSFLRSSEATVILKWWKETDAGRALAEALRSQWASDVEEIGGGRYTTEISTRGNGLGDFAFRGRSIVGVLSALALTVNVPPGDEALVTGDLRAEASAPCAAPAKGQALTGGYFAVQVSDDAPPNAAVKVPYRGHWFYVDDSCLAAKSTLSLLGQLYAMQAGLSNGSDTLILLGG